MAPVPRSYDCCPVDNRQFPVVSELGTARTLPAVQRDTMQGDGCRSTLEQHAATAVSGQFLAAVNARRAGGHRQNEGMCCETPRYKERLRPAAVHPWSAKMVGIECRACGERVLLRHELKVAA
jgi:hypothetical protein